jgi:cell wall-associated NlpC family hydrolase
MDRAQTCGCRTTVRRGRGAARVVGLGILLVCALPPTAIRAQRAVDLQVGGWAVSGPNPTLYSAALGRQLWGPLGYTLQGLALLDPDSSDRSLYGLGPQLSLFRGARTLSPYVVGGVALAFQPTSSPNVAALWNAGLGLEWNPIIWLGLAAEVTYLAEDSDLRGFWRLNAEDRRGWTYSARLAFRWGGWGGGSRDAGDEIVEPFSEGPELYDPGPSPPADVPPGDAAVLAERVVDTAISAMGEPYRWGGTSADEGFDCSGLVWYAYTSQGVGLPRTSRDQARAGRPVEPDVAALASGDILLFAERGDAVSHVGLYIGNGRFIHSTNSGGVRIGRLSAGGDADDRWWRQRWAGARRILP